MVDIIYRGCANENTPESAGPCRVKWFDKRLCFKSAWNMVLSYPDQFRMHVVWDGPPTPVLDYISRLMGDKRDIRQINVRAEMPALVFACGWAGELNGDYLYMLEDDYMHTTDAGKIFLEGTKAFPLFTLYDHPDRYTRVDDITAWREQVALTNSCHWRTAESTTGTNAISRTLWDSTKTFAPRFKYGDRDYFRLLISHNIRLWGAIPGRSTHCLAPYLGPLVNWENVSARLAP